MSVDLSTRYLGLALTSPLVPSASPLTGDLETLKRLEDVGAGAVVLPSLFEEQLESEQLMLHWMLDAGAGSHAEALDYFPDLQDYNSGPEAYLELVAAAKDALSIPVVASLNGTSLGGWLRYAELIEEAGADALELNLYSVETDLDTTAHDVEARDLAVVRELRSRVALPLAVKVGPYFTAFAHTAREFSRAGASGLVLFNRFLQPDIETETLAVSPSIHLSDRQELRLALRWIAILRGRLDVSLAATGGVHTPIDVVKALLAGADVAMTASALLEQGVPRLGRMLQGLELWLREHEYESVDQIKGSLSQASSPDPAAFERSSYVRAISSYIPRGDAPP